MEIQALRCVVCEWVTIEFYAMAFWPWAREGAKKYSNIVLENHNDITVEDVKKYCKKDLTGYKIPKHVKFVNDLPKSNVGKVLRRALKE